MNKGDFDKLDKYVEWKKNYEEYVKERRKVRGRRKAAGYVLGIVVMGGIVDMLIGFSTNHAEFSLGMVFSIILVIIMLFAHDASNESYPPEPKLKI